MPRPLLIGIIAMLLSGMALALLASALLLPQPAPPGRVLPDGTEVVDRFYAAVNETIATGDPAPVQQVVAPHFVEEHPLPGVRPGRAGLEEYLLTLHRSVPGLRLVAQIIVAAADRVVTRVEMQVDQVSHPLSGVGGVEAAMWSSVEVFRVESGVVVERWGDTDGLLWRLPLATAQLDLPTSTPRIVTLSRVSLVPNAQWIAPRAGPRLLVVEEGELVVGGDATISDASAASPGSRQSVGKVWVAPASASFSTTNVGGDLARLLVVTFAEPHSPNAVAQEPESLPSGVKVQDLAGTRATEVRFGRITLTLDRIMLARDAQLSVSTGEGPLLIAIEAGHLDATFWGSAWVRNGSTGRSTSSRQASPAAGDAVVLQPDSLLILHPDGDHPAEMLVLTLH
jgi:predicted SnoaL-like aldol condensation-catalyzing enzyme